MIAYFARHPTAANLLMVVILALGLLSLPTLQRDSFPVVPPAEVELRITYPGAHPGEVEEAICPRLEEALDGLAHLYELRCEARDNLAEATAQIEEGASMSAFFDEIQRRVDGIERFPALVERPLIQVLERVATVAGVMITGPMSEGDLLAYAEQVKARLQRDRRLASVSLRGLSEREILIEVSREMLQRHGLGVAELRTAIERQSVESPAGVLELSDGAVGLRLLRQSGDVEAFRRLIVLASPHGGLVRLGDIATVSTVFSRPEEKIIFNGQRAALLEVEKRADQDALRVMDALQELLERERQLAPSGVALTISQDVTTNILDRLRILLDNGLQGLILVLLTLWLFFNLRYSFWVAMGLPVSFLGALFVMQVFGYTINMMTLVALLVAIGLLMDDAIVIAENIAVRMREGGDALRGAIEGTRQVMPGVFASFLTTVLVVGPLAFLSGNVGAVLKYIPAVLVIALAVSLIEALLILPAHLRHAGLRATASRSPVHRAVEHGFERLRDRLFVPAVARGLNQPYLLIGVILALVLLSYATIPAGKLKYQVLPVLESDTIQARLLLPQGSTLERTEALVARLVTALEHTNEHFSAMQPEGKPLVSNVSVFYNTNADAYESGPHLATVSVDLLRAGERRGEMQAILAHWREQTGRLSDALALTITDRERGAAGRAIDIRLQGEDLGTLKQAAAELRRWLRGFNGVLEVNDDLRAGRPEYRILLRDEAASLGVGARELAAALRSAIHGSTALHVQQGEQGMDVRVRIGHDTLAGIEALQELPIRTPTGALIPLSALAELEAVKGYARIQRIDGQRTVSVQGNINPRLVNARELMAATRAEFLPQLRERYPGVELVFAGQARDSAETGSSLERNVVIGLAGVFVILSFLFRSYVQPIVVMMAIPTALVGVVCGHLLMGMPLSMPSLVGLATLGGVVINNAILLLGVVREGYAAGMAMSVACVEAVRSRFRAVLLTTLTTIAGLLPLLLETSSQAQFLIPLVVSLAFGLLSATVLTLFLIPALLVVLEEWDGYRAAAN